MIQQIKREGVCSASGIQTRFAVGFVRAKRIFNNIEILGLLSNQVDEKKRRLVVRDVPRRDSDPHIVPPAEIPLIEPRDIPWEQQHLYGTDFHSPYYDERCMSIWLSVLASQRWGSVILGGDEHDYYQLSRYDKDPLRMNDLQSELDQTVGLLKQIRKVAGPDTPIKKLWGNHEGRLDKHLRRNDVGMRSLRSNTLVEQLHLRELNIDLVPEREHYRMGNNFRIAHGAGPKDDGCEYSKHSGWSAKKNLEKFWSLGLSGHTHRGGSFYVTHGGKTYFWHEGFCLCDISRVSLDYATQANWQNGFHRIFTLDSGVDVVPTVIQNYCAVVDGKVYRA